MRGACRVVQGVFRRPSVLQAPASLCVPLSSIHLQDLERKKPIHNYSSTVRGFRIGWPVSFSSYCCILIPELGRGWEGRELGKPPCANHKRELPLDFFNCNKKDLDKNDRKHTHCGIIKASILGFTMASFLEAIQRKASETWHAFVLGRQLLPAGLQAELVCMYKSQYYNTHKWSVR